MNYSFSLYKSTQFFVGLLLAGALFFALPAAAEEEVVDMKALSAEDLINQSWAANAQGKLEFLEELVDECRARYDAKARKLQKTLKEFPVVAQKEEYQPLNDMGTCLFIQAEAAMNRGQKERAIELFQYIIDEFPWAQAWDARGWFWSVAEKAKDSIDVLTGKEFESWENSYEPTLRTRPTLYTPGTEEIIDYTKYGEFVNVGKKNYHYRIKDNEGLKEAIGEGIYPNIGKIYRNPRYKELKKEGRLDGTHWDFVNTDDLEASYFKWFTASEPWGVRMFFIGNVFEKAGMLHEALKAYHSLVVHFPKTVAYTYWQTPWYPGQAAIAKIRHILRVHPELGLEDKYMKITIKNGFDNITENDVITTFPGKIVKKNILKKLQGSLNIGEKESLGDPVKIVGKGKVQLAQYENDHWQLLVDGSPFLIKGITYEPTKVGQSPDKGTLENWMHEDTNENGLPDGPFDSWVDKNRNNKQDEDEPVVGDFQLMKEMGVNVLRLYHVPHIPNKELLRQLHKEYGIMVILGDFLGKYAIGSGATWAEGTDYENKEHRENMLEQVKKMVMEHKDEPYILMWVLGNENVYGVACNADKKPAAFFKFANEVAKWIKSVDKNHPVAINNGDTLYLDVFAKHSSHIDIFSSNVYRGNYGFGSFWEQVKGASGKPAFITEYGAPAYAQHLTLEEAEQAQADYHKGNWLDIYENSAGFSRGAGNSLGGVVFEWLDEWWKNYEPFRHDRKSDAVGPFPGGYYFEEWFGINSQGNGQKSPFLRQPRPSYYVYKEFWNSQ